MSTLTTPTHEYSQTLTSLVETWGGKAALACTDTEVVCPPSFSSLSIHWFYSNINGSLNHPWCIVIFHAHLFGVAQFNNNASEPARQKIINLEGIMNTCTVQTYFTAITTSSQQSLCSITSKFSMFIHVLASSPSHFSMPFDQPQLVISQTLPQLVSPRHQAVSPPTVHFQNPDAKASQLLHPGKPDLDTSKKKHGKPLFPMWRKNLQLFFL